MSDSDDTDVLLLIPPDLFLVPSSSSSDVCSEGAGHVNGKTGVISELVEHMQTLETRISAIEFRDNSLDASLLNNSLDSYIQGNICSKHRQTLPRTRLSVSQTSSLQNTPVKPRKSLSVPTTPSNCPAPVHINLPRNDMNLGQHFPPITGTNVTNANLGASTKHDTLMSYSDPFVIPSAYRSTELHVSGTLSKADTYLSLPADYRATNNLCYASQDELHSTQSASNLLSTAIGQPHTHSRAVQEMELSEVDELLQEMEATDLELSKRIHSTSSFQHSQEKFKPLCSGENVPRNHEKGVSSGCSFTGRKLDFQIFNNGLEYPDDTSTSKKKCNEIFADISLYNDSLNINDTDRIISEFKNWEQSIQNIQLPTKGQCKLDTVEIKKTSEKLLENLNTNGVDLQAKVLAKPIDRTSANQVQTFADPGTSNRTVSSATPSVHESRTHVLAPSHQQVEPSAEHLVDNSKKYDLQEASKKKQEPLVRCIAHVSTNTEPDLRKSQRLLSLSDFWDMDTNKSQEEMLRLKLEEEKFRREHCEYLIQELQKRLLEQQEKVAVAVRVDNEKNVLISQFHNAWIKLKQRVQTLETDHHDLEINLKSVVEKHHLEVSEFQAQNKRAEGELSKALDLAAGYKEKSDNLDKEKMNLLKSHADELENCKLLVQEAENRYDQMKEEYNKILDRNRHTEEILKNVQQDLNRERLRGSEVRTEMDVIHKALDTCEAELTVLKQEKESLQLKLKEEMSRNTLMKQKNISLQTSIDDAKKAEKLAKDETKSHAEQKEKIRTELQEVYQKQVDEVVKTKLQEFQTQLDSAETVFLDELKSRQQVIAECAARKIKDVMDKHRLEINLLEEKHKEEQRLYELQLAQAAQKSSMLEAELNSQHTTKSHLAEQLHSVMQRQWQQALKIISGDNLENMTAHRINAEKFFEHSGPKKSESLPNCYTRMCQEPLKMSSKPTESCSSRRIQPCQEQNESSITLTSVEDMPITSRRESRDDLRKYIKMIAEIQQAREEAFNSRENATPSPVCREVPKKHYMKKEVSILSEDSVTWQPVCENSTRDFNDYLPVSQKLIDKLDQQRYKPPWK